MTERRPIRKILIANRGEIARRIARTCRSLGIETVAVFSDADTGLPFVREADEAVRIGPGPSVESYLRIDRLIEAARRTSADAVHPGYGFLSENAAFAAACIEAGLVFIGPTPEAIAAMGSKREAKRIAASANVPVVPGYDGAEQETSRLAAEARKVGFPLLLKASGGGGGKGMRIVRDDRGLEEAIESARRESSSAFGDGTLLVEKYIEAPRHIEVQILGDAYGRLVHLFERECSIQRRHQKIIEEAPSPVLTPALREEMGAAAVRVGRAIGYQNAGTVEFILAPDGQFYFLEVNTRLQVEHPITECITGIDLVREQIRIAEGAPLDDALETLSIRGAAIECRLYAEDPAAGFLPQSGRLVDFDVPYLEGLRVDAGVERGSEVSIHYDPMLAKVITWGDDRIEALRRMRYALSRLSVQGVVTNRALLLKILEHPDFVAGNVDTHFIERALVGQLSPEPTAGVIERAAFAATLAAHEVRRRARTHLPRIPSGFRNNRFRDAEVRYITSSGELTVAYRSLDETTFRMQGATEAFDVIIAALDERTGAIELLLEIDGVRRRYRVLTEGDAHFVSSNEGSLRLVEPPLFADRASEGPKGGLVAPMPGRIVRLAVAAGDRVESGQLLVVMEAMKMEHSITAPSPGIVQEVPVAVGDQVDGGAVLAVLEDVEAGA